MVGEPSMETAVRSEGSTAEEVEAPPDSRATNIASISKSTRGTSCKYFVFDRCIAPPP